MRSWKILLIGGFAGIVSHSASAQDVTILGVAGSKLTSRSLCAVLGGQAEPPTFTIRHAKAAGSITVSMIDKLNNGGTVNHGSTTVKAEPGGTTVVRYSFLAPCNRRTGEGLKSAYYVTATSGGSSKTILWARYP